jgi:hypothetical protein
MSLTVASRRRTIIGLLAGLLSAVLLLPTHGVPALRCRVITDGVLTCAFSRKSRSACISV